MPVPAQPPCSSKQSKIPVRKRCHPVFIPRLIPSRKCPEARPEACLLGNSRLLVRLTITLTVTGGRHRFDQDDSVDRWPASPLSSDHTQRRKPEVTERNKKVSQTSLRILRHRLSKVPRPNPGRDTKFTHEFKVRSDRCREGSWADFRPLGDKALTEGPG